jgi:DNA polymerase-1
MAKKAAIEGIEFERHDIVALPAARVAFAELRKQEVLGFDIETTDVLNPLDGQIRTMQFAFEDEGTGEITAFVFDLFAVPEAFELLRPLLESGDHRIVGQNLSFESTWCWHHGLRMRAPLFDTMLADKILNNGKPDAKQFRGLADLCEDYLGLGLDKTMQVSGWGKPAPGGLSESQLNYAALDAVVVLPLRKVLRSRLKAPCGDLSKKPVPITQEVFEDPKKRAIWPHKPQEDLQLVTAIEMAAIPVLAGMTYHGLPFDQTVWDHCTARLEIAAEQAFTQMVADFDALSQRVNGRPMPRNLLGELETNWSAATQVIALFQQLELPVPEATDPKTGKPRPSVDQTLLKDGPVADYPELRQYLVWKELATALTKAAKQHEYVDPRTSRIHARYLPMGAATGRLSARNPNVMQVQKALKVSIDGVEEKIDFRAAFTAEPGWVMIDADLDQVELRIASVLAPDENLRQIFFSAKPDPHSTTARLMNNIPDDQPVPDKARSEAKGINFGKLFCMGANKFRSYAFVNFNLRLSEEESVESHQKYQAAYPGIASWHAWCKEEARLADNMAKSRSFAAGRDDEDPLPAISEAFTISGRRRYLYGGDVKPSNLANTRVQGSNADLVLLAMGRLYDALEEAGCPQTQVVLQCHDELLLHSPIEESERAARVLEQQLIKAGDFFFKGLVPITTTADSGPSWAAVK